MKYDVVLMNPPYSGSTRPGDGLYIDFLNKCLKISDKTISINPCPLLFSHNENSPLKQKLKEIINNINNQKPEIEIINNIFDAGIKGDICIIKFDSKNKNDKIIILNKDKKYEFNNHNEIIFNDNEYLYNFKNRLYEFMLGMKINKYINLKYPNIYYKDDDNIKTINVKRDNLYNHIHYGKNGAPYKKFTCKIEKNIDKNKIYIFLMKPDTAFNYWLYKDTKNQGIKYDKNWFEKRICYIKCDNIDESKNICSYLNSSFSKIILKLCGMYFHPYLKYDFTPWLDFSKSYTDKELFEMIGMEEPV